MKLSAFHLRYTLNIENLGDLEAIAENHGALCISYEPQNIDDWPAESDSLPLSGLSCVTLTFENPEDAENCQKELALQGFEHKEVEHEQIEEWLYYHRPYLEPMDFGPLNIYPWRKGEREDPVASDHTSNVIYLPAGLGFGTGRHETTQLCLEAMVDVDLRDKTLIDFGCGSGILAIAAAKLGAKSIQYHDHDPQAMKASLENCLLNTVEHCIPCLDAKDLQKSDILVANILLEPLILLRETLCDLIHLKGIGIFSGILEEQKNRFLSEYSQNFKCLEIREKGQWICIIMQKIS